MSTDIDIEGIARRHFGEPVTSPPPNGGGPPQTLITPWPEIDRLAAGGMAFRVEGLIPIEGSGFIGSAPGKGKSWLSMGLGIAVAMGVPFLERFEVVERCPVVYVACEGTPAGNKARIGALARGMGIDPDSAEFREWFQVALKPPGINLSDPHWAARLVEDVERICAGLVIVDVLRSAAAVRESGDGVGDFSSLMRNLAPLHRDHRFLMFAHHFRKEGKGDENVDSAERVAGSGSLRGAWEMALLITSGKAPEGFVVEVDKGREWRPPRPFRVEIQGEQTGPWGYVYEDAARMVAVDAPPRRVTKASADEIRGYLAAAGGSASPGVLKEHFGIADKTLRDRRPELEAIGVVYVNAGRESRYEIVVREAAHE